MTIDPTPPPSTDRPPDDPRLALLRALNAPPYDLAAGKTSTPLNEAVQLIDDYRAVVLCEGADGLGRMDYDTDANDYGYDSYRDAWNGGAMDGAELLRRMADERSSADTYRASILRDFLWRLEQSSGDQVAAKLVEENPEWAELLSATEATDG